ncbi:hypothetical protein ACFL21_00885 [Patescibacteria group bacterium]
MLDGYTTRDHLSPAQKLDVLPIALRPDDSTLAELAYPGSRAICSETFMYVSRDNYPLLWMIREIVQNFIDHNQSSIGTLDGVDMQVEDLDSGKKRFIFTGGWPFHKFDCLVSFGTTKIGTDVQLSGGNGIGIKQAALRMMRDLDVDRFNIVGEGWEVNYQLTSAENINERLNQLGSEHQVETGSFLVNVKNSENRGQCQYIIETDNPEVISALQTFYELGVCKDNPHLNNPDFQSQYGAIKWGEDFKPGKIFINGQIFRFNNKDETNNADSDYWGGPCGITIQLNNIEYPMSIDRPPVNSHELARLSGELISNMSKHELINNLLASEHLWSNYNNRILNYKQPSSFNIISAIITQLYWGIGFPSFRADEYQNIWGHKKYLCDDISVSEKERHELEANGFTLCPKFFEKIHMPGASTVVNRELVTDDIDEASKFNPNIKNLSESRFKTSTKTGVLVPYSPLEIEEGAIYLGDYIKKTFAENFKEIKLRSNKKNTIQIVLNTSPYIYKEDLIHNDPNLSNLDDAQKIVQLIRNIAKHGLSRDIIKNIFLAQGIYVSVLAEAGNELAVKNNCTTSEEHFIEITLSDEDFDEFYQGFMHGIPEEDKKEEDDEEPKDKADSEQEEIEITFEEPEEEVDSEQEEREKVAQDLITETPTEKAFFEQRHSYHPTIATPEFRRLPGISGTIAKTLMAIFLTLALVYGVSKVDLDSIMKKFNNKVTNILSDNTTKGNHGIDIEINGESKGKQSLDDIFNKWKTANVGSSNRSSQASVQREQTKIKNFEVLEMSNDQIEQFKILKKYIYLTTGYLLPNKFYVFKGQGAFGLNNGRNLGLHLEMFSVSFEEALGVFIHETVHNNANGHGPNFQLLFAALHAEIQDSLADIANTSETERTEEELEILAAEKAWDKLR